MESNTLKYSRIRITDEKPNDQFKELVATAKKLLPIRTVPNQDNLRDGTVKKNRD